MGVRVCANWLAVASQAECGVVAWAQQELSSAWVVFFQSFICEHLSPQGTAGKKMKETGWKTVVGRGCLEAAGDYRVLSHATYPRYATALLNTTFFISKSCGLYLVLLFFRPPWLRFQASCTNTRGLWLVRENCHPCNIGTFCTKCRRCQWKDSAVVALEMMSCRSADSPRSG